MLLPRLIPSLLLDDGLLVKTTQFSKPKYIGDPLNAIRIFNEKKCDELVLFDIHASSKKSPINFSLLERIARISNMPLCYGGGVKSLDDARRLINIGFEKISFSSAFFSNPALSFDIAQEFGSQSVVVTLDILKSRFFRSYKILTHNAKNSVDCSFDSALDLIKSAPVGELIINTIHCDGMYSGYDIDLIKLVKNKLSIPLVLLGGASSLEDVASLFSSVSSVAAAASSIFIYQGKYRSVLISYPPSEEKMLLYGDIQS